jgi:hypothetical protein
MNRLPPELIDAIIGHVYEKYVRNGRSHLLACSLVCRLWRPFSQSHLLHHINYRRREGPQLDAEIRRLDQTLLNSPHLASYIRVLELPDMESWRLSTQHRAHRQQLDWIGIDQSLSPLLLKLTRVKRLKIRGMDWNELPRDFAELLCRVLELPSMAFVDIDKAEFDCMDDFTNFIRHARGITGLSFNVVRTTCVPKVETKQAEDNEERSEPHHISHLNRLDMMCKQDTSTLINWLLGPQSHLGVSHIHTLHLSVPATEGDSANQLLCAIGRSLKHLSIIPPGSCECPAVRLGTKTFSDSLAKVQVFVNLAFNVNIETLSLVRINVEHDLSPLTRVLSTIDASNCIHHMELRLDPIYTCDRGMDCEGWDEADWDGWEEVYRVLAGPQFQSLKVLYINVGHMDRHLPSVPSLHEEDPLVLTSRLMVDEHPSLAARGASVSYRELLGDQCIFCWE